MLLTWEAGREKKNERSKLLFKPPPRVALTGSIWVCGLWGMFVSVSKLTLSLQPRVTPLIVTLIAHLSLSFLSIYLRVSEPSGSGWKVVPIKWLHLVPGCGDCFSGLRFSLTTRLTFPASHFQSSREEHAAAINARAAASVPIAAAKNDNLPSFGIVFGLSASAQSTSTHTH